MALAPITELKGFRGNLHNNLQYLIEKYPQLAKKAAKAEAEIEKVESQRITPYRTGKLHDSHGVIEPYVRQNMAGGSTIYTGLVAGIYNGVVLDYAVYVHEDTEAFHQPPTQAKFLEQTWRKASKSMAGRIANRMQLSLIVGPARGII